MCLLVIASTFGEGSIVLLNSVTCTISKSQRSGWLVGVEFNAPLDTVWVISEAVFTANHLTDTDKQNSTGKYR